MNWLKRARQGIKTWRKRNLPDGLWEKCPSCTEILYKKELERIMSVCPKCSFHFRIDAPSYLEILTVPGSFEERDGELVSVDPLNFKDSRKYKDRIRDARKVTGQNAAVITGTAVMNNRRIAIAVMDFAFMGGSMGSVEGERIARIARSAVEERLPLIIVSASGGARMQESVLSLMQLAKTSASIAAVSEAGLPFISILTNPTTGGVAASFAFQGDIIIAEPKALIGFAGPRVIRETVGGELPEGFQRSEFLLEHGMIDLICHRQELSGTVSFILDSLISNAAAHAEEENQGNDLKTIPLVR
jgi:acetyl-CoA carboxylase carboxyl transferase subunit beta